MVKAKEIKAKSIITKSNLPESDYVINPYTGCKHACLYCYARFMKRFTGHDEPWGSFVDVKVNAPDLITKSNKWYDHSAITIGSVTDPYQPAEKKYRITREILEKLISFKSSFNIITKSALVTRDIDLLKQFHDMTVAFSLAFTNERIRKKLEPNAPSVVKRLKALRELHRNKIRTALFISPIFSFLSDWETLIKKTKNFVDEYWFENLNIYPSVRNNIYGFLNDEYPELIDEYKKIYADEKKYWNKVEDDIRAFCEEEGVNYKIYFYHKEIKKK